MTQSDDNDSFSSLLEGYFHSVLEALETVDHIGPLLKHFHSSLYFHASLQYDVVAGLSLFLLVLFVSFLVCLYKLCCRRRRSSRDPLPQTPEEIYLVQEKKKKVKELLQEEKEKNWTAAKMVDYLLSERSTNYSKDKALPDMGSRTYKYWFRVISQDTYGCHILTISDISEYFRCNRKVEMYLNERLSQLDHPYLQTINEIRFITDNKKGKEKVAIIQPYWEQGSLKDIIYKTSPITEWSTKYKRSDGLSADKVSLYGSQILEAVLYLYEKNLEPLGHIQTGNIYIEGEHTCRLGGYENLLLEYRSRLHRTIDKWECLADIDVIMFGHVIYEMSVGVELSRLTPIEEDYKQVKDENCREILKYIFEEKKSKSLKSKSLKFKRSIKDIKNHWFFGGKGCDPDIEPTKSRGKSEIFRKAREYFKK